MNETITMGTKTVSRIVAPIQMPKLKRVAAYARVSTNSEEQLTSYEAQVKHYTEHRPVPRRKTRWSP